MCVYYLFCFAEQNIELLQIYSNKNHKNINSETLNEHRFNVVRTQTHYRILLVFFCVGSFLFVLFCSCGICFVVSIYWYVYKSVCLCGALIKLVILSHFRLNRGSFVCFSSFCFIFIVIMCYYCYDYCDCCSNHFFARLIVSVFAKSFALFCAATTLTHIQVKRVNKTREIEKKKDRQLLYYWHRNWEWWKRSDDERKNPKNKHIRITESSGKKRQTQSALLFCLLCYKCFFCVCQNVWWMYVVAGKCSE